MSELLDYTGKVALITGGGSGTDQRVWRHYAWNDFMENSASFLQEA
ncbi:MULTISPECIES: hypothetical protein [unclassified Bradyrhizobium]|nr:MULTISPECIES: hypothetical protein [unclassified Bradyrhizobium]WGR73182.1 hypothetical protein MTX24_10265 [Bradyrhizobium sp. ISRA426]WGR78021.1 hypothetical protein MTX21_35235 [Bradyrhizobium sp. ISRA430]WGR88422.1 hypothetical protein MTX25_10275 [Bradyrhizobium sp. ISRA432]